MFILEKFSVNFKKYAYLNPKRVLQIKLSNNIYHKIDFCKFRGFWQFFHIEFTK